MVIEPDEEIILGLCKVGLTSEHLAVYWASADTLTLPAGTQLLRLPFLECRGAGMTSAKYGKLSGSQQIVITRQNRAKLRLCYLQKPFLSRIVVYICNPWEECHLHKPALPVLILVVGTEFKALFPAILCQICHVFLPNILLHAAVRLSFERTWRAGGMIRLHSTLYAGYFYRKQTYMGTVLFRAL